MTDEKGLRQRMEQLLTMQGEQMEHVRQLNDASKQHVGMFSRSLHKNGANLHEMHNHLTQSLVLNQRVALERFLVAQCEDMQAWGQMRVLQLQRLEPQ